MCAEFQALTPAHGELASQLQPDELHELEDLRARWGPPGSARPPSSASCFRGGQRSSPDGGIVPAQDARDACRHSASCHHALYKAKEVQTGPSSLTCPMFDEAGAEHALHVPGRGIITACTVITACT